MPKRALRRWLDRELADQRMKAEQRIQRISATPVPEGTIAYHPELELVADERKDKQASFIDAPTEVFFSVDIDVDVEGMVDDESITTDPTDFDVELPSWSREASGIQTKVGKKPRRPKMRAQSREDAPPRETTTLVDESPWWGAYAEMSPPSDWADEDAETRKHIGSADETPRLIDTLRPQEKSAITETEKQPAKRGVHPGVFLAAAVAAAAILGVGFHFAQSSSTAAHADAGILQVRLAGNAESATVFVDGVERGVAPLTLGTLTPGSHDVRVVADGFRELTQDVEVASGATTIVAASLNAIDAEPEADEAPAEAETAEAEDAVEEERAAEELSAAEQAELARAEERRARQERWERLQAIRARRARIAARNAAPSDEETEETEEAEEAAPSAPAALPRTAPEPEAAEPPAAQALAAGMSPLRPAADAPTMEIPPPAGE
jgi:hypothetical protein